MSPILTLASASPRRRELLDQIGVPCDVCPVDLDERQLAGEVPATFVERLARAKAAAGCAAVPGRPALGADTAVVVDDAVLGKPQDEAHALEMLARLSGRTHEVFSGVAVTDGTRADCAVVCTRVAFRETTDTERAAYWRSGEPVGKAGAYAIQGIGAVFVEWLEGSYSAVVGLPLFETARLLRPFGLDPLAP